MDADSFTVRIAFYGGGEPRVGADYRKPFADEFLGSSVIYEEYKGDFARASQTAEAAVNKARGQSSPVLLADALLGRGIVHVLQGEPSSALACFEECERLVPTDPVRRLRAATYSNLANHLQFNAFPDGRSSHSREIDARWDGVADAKEHSPRRQALLQQIDDPAVELESKLVDELLVNTRVGRGFVDADRTHDLAMGARLLDTALSSPQAFERHAESVGASRQLRAASMLMAASLCWWGRDLKRARKYLSEAQQGYQQARDLAGEAVCEMNRGDWLAAPLSSPGLWNFLIKEGLDSSDLGWTIESLEFDSRLAGRGDIAEAQAAYAAAGRLFEDAGARRGSAALRLREGYLAALEGDYASAVRHGSAALEHFEATGDLLGTQLARTHLLLGWVGLGRFPEDSETATAIGSWGRQRGSFSYALGLGLLLSRGGRYWLVRKGDYERALACFRLAETLFRALAATGNAAQSLVDQAMTYHAIGEPYAAAAAYERARDLYSRVPANVPALAGAFRWQTSKLEREIYSIYEKHRNADGMARCLARLEQMAAQPVPQMGEDDWAADMFSGFSYLASTHSNTMVVETGRVMLYRVRALEARDAGDLDESEHQFQLALAAVRQADPEWRDVLEARLLADQRRYPEAGVAVRRYLARGGANGGFRGTLADMMGKVFGEQGKAIASRQDRHTLEYGAMFFTTLREYGEAKQYLDELEQLVGKRWWQHHDPPWEPLLDYAETYEGLGHWQDALNYYDQAIEQLEARRRTLSRDELKTALVSDRNAQRIYFGAARTALRLQRQAELAGDEAEARGRAAQAFAYAERGKARALLDLMAASALPSSATPVKSQVLAGWRQLSAQLVTWRGLLVTARAAEKPDRDRIDYLEKQIEADEAALRKAEESLVGAELQISCGNGSTQVGFLPKSRKQQSQTTRGMSLHEIVNPQASVSSLEDVMRALPAETVLLQYYFLGDELLAWAITRDGMLKTICPAVDVTALERQIRSFHRACAGRQPLAHDGRELADLLLAPMQDILRSYPHVLVVPFGVMHLLPFHALLWEGQPLVATHRVSYLPSASLLRFVGAGRMPVLSDRLLAVGNPARMAYQAPLDGPPQPQPPLPAATTEATFVAALFPQGEALVGNQATEAEVRGRLSHYSILHFATHGHLSDEAPMLSSLLLADGEALTVYELMGLRLDADLVVLSACETGRGKVTGGDEVLGLTRGLLASGARAAVVSLWPVSDVSTTLLMGAFYRRLRAGDSPAQALRSAQNYLRRLRGDAIDQELERLQEAVETSIARRGNGRRNREFDAGIRNNGSHRRRQTESRDYSHPFYWAPFVLVG